MDIKAVKKLVKLLKDEDLTILNVSDDDMHIHIERNGAEGVVQQVSNNTGAAADEKSNETSELIDITATQIGTFYNQPDENSEEPFVSAGDKISKGDQVGFIEAMKVFNDVKSDISGTVEEITVNNGEIVEFGDVLLRVRPEGA